VATHKILVIDDSKVIRMRVREMLPAGNFEVLEAKDGIEGLNLIQQERPNLAGKCSSRFRIAVSCRQFLWY
jgi:two-component system response regulator